MKMVLSDNHTYLKQAITNENQFRKRIQELVYDLWVGDIDEYEFYAEMNNLVLHGYRSAWEEGQDAVGISVFLPYYQSRITQQARRDMSYAYGFAAYIAEHDRESGGKFSSLSSRMGLWENGFNKIRNLAKYLTGQERHLRWDRYSKDGCSSCIALEGRIYTARQWNGYGIRPQHPSLACMRDAGGIPVCRCKFTVVDDPVSTIPFPEGEVKPWAI